AERGSRRRIKAEQRRRPPATARLGRGVPRGLLDDEAALLQIRHERRDRGAREAGQPRELAPARRPPPPESVDHPQSIALPETLERAQLRHRGNFHGPWACLSRACEKSAGGNSHFRQDPTDGSEEPQAEG